LLSRKLAHEGERPAMQKNAAQTERSTVGDARGEFRQRAEFGSECHGKLLKTPTIGNPHGFEKRVERGRENAIMVRQTRPADDANPLHMTAKSARRLLHAAAILAAFSAHASAQSYPMRPIRMLVGYTPAGPTDLMARLAAQNLSEALGQQVVVDNRPGAGGTVSGAILAQSPPDGYTIALGANGEIAIAPNLRTKMPYDPVKDFAPISRIGSGQLVLVTYPGVPARSVAELVALAKAKPGAINFASSGTGSTAHLAGELFKHMAGIDIVHVPYKGAGPALTDLIAGQVQMLITGYSGAVPHIKAGRLRALAVTGVKRLAAAPDTPTVADTLKGYEVVSWYGIFAPKNTPGAIVSRLHQELAAMVKRPQVIEKMTALGVEPEGNTPQEFARQITSEVAKWGRVVKLAQVPRE
jgi:tripartite-type tricarboxylate transporter receptor subunit TctC